MRSSSVAKKFCIGDAASPTRLHWLEAGLSWPLGQDAKLDLVLHDEVMAAREHLARRDHPAREGRRGQEDGALAVDCEDGGLHAHRAGPGIEDQIDPVAEPFGHVLRIGRADRTGRIGAGRNERPAECRDQGLGRVVRRHADTERVDPGSGEVADWRVILFR